MITKILKTHEEDLLLWIPIFFIFGIVFFISFEVGFYKYYFCFLSLLLSFFILFYLNKENKIGFIFLLIFSFIAGSFYGSFYEKYFLNQTEVTGKIFARVEGRVESVKKFYNPSNRLHGLSLTIIDPNLYQDQGRKNKDRKKSKIKNPSKRTIKKKFLNIEGYQKIDRKFLDYSKNYQNIDWKESPEGKKLPNPPKRIVVTITKVKQDIFVNDLISFFVMLQPQKSKEFSDDFDFRLYSKMKKIGAYGYVLGDVDIIKREEISSPDQWFIYLRENIKLTINRVLKDDSSGIAEALLIGDKSNISKELMEKIRNSGLAHLLAISGFHMALAGGIFFISISFLLSRSEYLTLNFDVKKISVFAAVIASYFYLKIANSPIPATRAFLMVLLVFLAMTFDEKPNSRRLVVFIATILVLINPYVIFSIGFQLSFVAVLIIILVHESFLKAANRYINQTYFKNFFRYFFEILIISFAIQIAITPFLMSSFQNVTVLGFFANIIAIPLASFIIMPFGFLGLILMPLGLEGVALYVMGEGISLMKGVIFLFDQLSFSHFQSPKMSNLGVLIAIFAILLTSLLKSKLKFIGILLFLASFLTLFLNAKPDILFDNEQKFFAFYDEKNGLVFSKKLRVSKHRKLWMKKMNESEFKYMNICEKERCEFEKNSKKFLVLLKRNKISDICKNDFDILVNLTARYSLPDCLGSDKRVIDNLDFYQKGGHFFFVDGDEFRIKTTL